MEEIRTLNSIACVALHPEGVDRNRTRRRGGSTDSVALHPEGVDRNRIRTRGSSLISSVALHPEGVDRNCGISRF